MFRIRPSIDLGNDQAPHTPGLHNFRPPQEVVPGFRLNTDDPEPSGLRLGPTALYLFDDLDAAQAVAPVRCTSDGSTLDCTTPKGLSWGGLPVERFPPEIAPSTPHHHGTDVLSPPGASADKLLQGIIDKPTPGPPRLNRPATPAGTLNEATPDALYDLYIGASKFPWRRPYGTPLSQVTSHLRYDREGNPIVINVTRPSHGLAPGYVVHYLVRTPEGPRIQTEGEGLSPLQGPSSPKLLREYLNKKVWDSYHREIVNRSK